jgi:hypothetical protein
VINQNGHLFRRLDGKESRRISASHSGDPCSRRLSSTIGCAHHFGHTHLLARSHRSDLDGWSSYRTFCFAFLRSLQYFFIRFETASRASCDIRRPRLPIVFTVRRSARRVCGNANSGNVRSIAMISARSCFNADPAPDRASSRNRSALNFNDCFGTVPLIELVDCILACQICVSPVDSRSGWHTSAATVRSNRVSRARYTSPMPPAPRSVRIS